MIDSYPLSAVASLDSLSGRLPSALDQPRRARRSCGRRSTMPSTARCRRARDCAATYFISAIRYVVRRRPWSHHGHSRPKTLAQWPHEAIRLGWRETTFYRAGLSRLAFVVAEPGAGLEPAPRHLLAGHRRPTVRNGGTRPFGGVAHAVSVRTRCQLMVGSLALARAAVSWLVAGRGCVGCAVGRPDRSL